MPRNPRRSTTHSADLLVGSGHGPRLGGSPQTQVERSMVVATKATAQHYSTVRISLSGLATATAPAWGVRSSDTGGAWQGVATATPCQCISNKDKIGVLNEHMG